MKMRKAISMFMTAAMVLSMAVTAFAATTADSEPAVTATVKEVDGDGYAIMQFKLTNNEELSYKLNRGKYTSNGINTIQVKLTLDETVFDVSESYISGGFTGVNVAGDGTAQKSFVFAPTSIDSYMIEVPEYLFQVDALLKDGYTAENIPATAITYGECIVEYTSYNNIAATDGPSTHTIYAINAATSDYDLTVGVDETFVSEGGDEPDEPVVDDVWTSDEVPSIEAGKKVVAHSENVTVTADSRVEITVDGTSRLFGSAIGEYLAKKDIILDGEATANVRFALLVNEAANEITFNVVD